MNNIIPILETLEELEDVRDTIQRMIDRLIKDSISHYQQTNTGIKEDK